MDEFIQERKSFSKSKCSGAAVDQVLHQSKFMKTLRGQISKQLD